MFESSRENYLYREGFKATTEMYTLLENGYFGRDGWSLGDNHAARGFLMPDPRYPDTVAMGGNYGASTFTRLSKHGRGPSSSDKACFSSKPRVSWAAKDFFGRESDAVSDVTSSVDIDCSLIGSTYSKRLLTKGSSIDFTPMARSKMELRHDFSQLNAKKDLGSHSVSLSLGKSCKVPSARRHKNFMGSHVRNTGNLGGSLRQEEELCRHSYFNVVDFENDQWKWNNSMQCRGIVNLDKTQITQLTEENEKLRKKISDFQRENIKLKEDFNELKMYNDKAQTTIKDLRTCLDDARNERKQLISEIKKLQTGAQTKSISSIINHYMEKGLYEEAEKDHMNQRARSRSNTPVADRVRERSVSPVPFRSGSPVRHSASSTTPSISNYHTPIYSPVPRIPTPTSSPYRPSTPVMSYTPLSRSQTPNHLEDEVREIYPHRRTRSYIEKYGTNEDEDNKAVDFSDPELLELLKPQPKFDDELDADVGKEEKPRLMFSPYMDKDYMPKFKQGEIPGSDKLSKPKPTNNYRPPLQRKISMDEFENKKFVQALDHAVKETPAQLAQQQFLRDLDLVGTEEVPQTRWRNPAKGILKTAKSAQNMSIKESTSPSRRSVESRSYSPSVRNSQGPFISRSYTPDTKGNYSSPLSKYSPSTMQPRSHSPGIRNPSPGSLTARSHSPGSRSYSPERQWNGTRDSGYSTPTTSTRLRGTAATDVNHRLLQTSKSQQQKDSSPNKGSLLTDQERRYADLLIDKYTRQHLIGLPLASSCS